MSEELQDVHKLVDEIHATILENAKLLTDPEITIGEVGDIVLKIRHAFEFIPVLEQAISILESESGISGWTEIDTSVNPELN